MNKYTLHNRAENGDKSKNRFKNLFYLFALTIMIMSSVTPAFAAGTTPVPSGMFEALDVALKWVRRIFLVGAAVSVVSYAFSFFFSFSGDRDVEKRVSAAWKKIGATCLACAALMLVPSFIMAGKEAVESIKWKSGSSVVGTSGGNLDAIHGALSGNHVVPSASTGDKPYAEVDTPEPSETPETDTP